jgi:hypothetical protein
MQSEKTEFQDAALEKPAQLALDKPWHAPSLRAGPGEERLQRRRHGLMQNG